MTGGSIQVLRHLAERVIEQIERRLESSERDRRTTARSR